MNQKTLIGLGLAALIAIVAAVVLNQRSQPRSEGGEQVTYAAPELRDHVNDVNKLVVTGADNQVVATLVRGGDGWTLTEKGGYAADTGKLREFLLKLADTRLLEEKTSNKDKYAALGVEDVSAKDAKGVQVQLDGLAKPYGIIIGNTNARGGSFVRRAGEAQSWLASAPLTLPKTAAEWLKKDLADVAAARIQSVAIARADGKNVRVYKGAAGDANFTLVDVPKGREAGAEFTINALASTLAGLRFDDVLPAKDAAPADGALKARYATFDGVIVDATAWEKDGKDYAQFKASLDAAAADAHIVTAQAKSKADFEVASAAADAAKKANAGKDAKDAAADEAADAPIKPLSVGDPAKDREMRLAALNKEVAELNAHFDGWTYVLPAYKYAAINKSPDELLKPLEDKKPADAAKKPGENAKKPGEKPSAAKAPVAKPAQTPPLAQPAQ